jgi:CelD/BcsL family acetyltransferase involved in cellulose biosynthesis
VLERCPYLIVEGTYDDLLASRGGNLRRGLPRRWRRLRAQGEVEFDVRDGGDDLDRLLEDGFAVEASGWKGRNGTAIRSTPATRAFYTEIARWLEGRCALKLGFLRLDGRAIAFEFCIEEGGRHLSLKSGYDERHRSDAPGVLLRSAMLERVFACGLERYDFLGTDEDWKMAWASRTEVQVQFQVFRRSPHAAADWAAQRYLRPLARRFLKRTRRSTPREL